MTVPLDAPPTDASFAPAPRVSILRIAAWGLIGAAILAFVVAGDVRTNWVVGDTLPEQGEVALPRLGAIALMLGLTLLIAHQIRQRRTLDPARYRGASVLALVGVSIGLSVAMVLPIRETVNLLFEGGSPDLVPLLIWQSSTQLAVLFVWWVAVWRTGALAGSPLFATAKLMRHAVVGIASGLGLFAVSAALLMVAELARTGSLAAVLDGVFAGPPPEIAILPIAALAVVLTPAVEEIFFRGFVLRAWQREYGLAFGLVGSSLLFGLVHFGLNPIEALPAAVPDLLIKSLVGLALGFLAIRTGSLVAPIAAHATLNAAPFLLALL